MRWQDEAPGGAPELRRRIVPVIAAALSAVDARQAVLAHVTRAGDRLQIGQRDYDLSELDRILVVGAGKAGAPMAAAVAEVLGDRLTAGSVNVKYGHTAGPGGWSARFGKGGGAVAPAVRALTGPIAIVEAGHPLPDAAGLAGARTMAALLQGLGSRDLVIVLLSGGGSALLPLPAGVISLADLQALTNLLLRSGADIQELNTVRKHCSLLQGGQLARLAAPAQVAALILSDVVGSPLDVIASGPTVPDRSTFSDALAVFERYGITEQAPPSIRDHVERGRRGELPDTPKAGDGLFDGVNNVLIGDNESAARAGVAAARASGLEAQLLSTYIQGEAREVGRVVAGLAQGIATGASDIRRPACLVLGGETTVTVHGQGMGGRNQELALATAIALGGYELPAGREVAVVSLGTDGTDGPTDAAGAIATPETLARGATLGLDALAALAANDSYHYLDALGDLLLTGPTNTNVNDLVFIFVV